MNERTITIGDVQTAVTVSKTDAVYEVSRDGRTDRVQIVRLRDNEADLLVNGRPEHVAFLVEGETVTIFRKGEVFTVEVASPQRARSARHRDHSMTAPMPGVVLKIFVSPGEVVQKGAPLLILEAMKMEHQIAAPRNGTVSAVRCTVGELVQPGVELITLDEKNGE